VRVLLSRLTRGLKPAPWVVWLVLSALLFLVGSASFDLGGAHHAAQLGVIGALVAVAIIVAFAW